MNVKRRAFFQGVGDIAPNVLGVIPFAIIVGISAISIGLSKTMAVAMSAIIFAGSAQLAAIELFGQQAPMVIIVLTGLIINLRFAMYSASLAPYFKDLSLPWKGCLAYLLCDQAYAASIISYNEGLDEGVRHWYYLGTALTIWVPWIFGTAAGVFLGAEIPAAWALDFAIPLTFLSLLLPSIKDMPTVVAAISAGAIALIGHELPFNLGLFLAALAGVFIGYAVDKKGEHVSQS